MGCRTCPESVLGGERLIIDCDVHQTRRSDEELLPYLPEPWKSEVKQYGQRRLESGIINEGGMRWDSTPPDGGPPGSNPDFLRAQLLDKYDYAYALLTGSGYHISGIPDPEYAQSMCSAYNDHTLHHWLPKDKRFRIAIMVAPQDPYLAAREIDRLGDHPDVVMVAIPSTTRIPLGNRFFYPMYEAAERKGLPLGVHTGQSNAMLAQASATPAGVARTYLEWHTCVPQIYMANVASLILEGVFERFPRLKFTFIEGGFDWLPHLLWRMDGRYKGLRQEAPWLKRLPSEYVQDHIRLTTQPWPDPKQEDHMLQIFDMMDAEHVLMFASDYPHWDFDESTVLPKKLSETARKRILHDNAAEWFGLE